MARIAMIGATGLVGRLLAPRLVAAGHDLLLLGRRPAGVAGAREAIGPMGDWPALVARQPVDIAISTLGTTWKKARDWAAFEAVDGGAVRAFAAAAHERGARQMISVSSVGADPASRNRYLALKGRAEAGLADLGLARLDLIRPGLLRGARGHDRRPGERFGILVSPALNLVLRGPLDRYAAIEADTVATAIAALAGAQGEGCFIHENRAIRSAARAG